MKCNQFEQDVTEWVRGRTEETRNRLMQDHVASCSACHRLSETERRLMRIVAHSAADSTTPDIWSRLEDRVIQTPQRVHSSLRRFFAFGGAAAAFGACALALMVMPRGPVVSPVTAAIVAPDVERHVVQLVSDTQRLSEPDAETAHIGSGDAAALLVARNE